MTLKDCVVPALCVLATLWFVRGCEGKRSCACSRNYAPQQPAPICQRPVQQPSVYYQRIYDQPVQTKIIRRTIRRTIRTPYYYEY